MFMCLLQSSEITAKQVIRIQHIQATRCCRYEVVKASGKGVFSSVVTSTDKLRQDADGNNPLVAIKVIRANDTMYKAGQLELKILNSLAEADPENRRHVIRLLRSFEYRNHLCLVRLRHTMPHLSCSAQACEPDSCTDRLPPLSCKQEILSVIVCSQLPSMR